MAPRPSCPKLLLALAAISAVACTPERTPVEFSLVHGPTQDPWLGAETLLFALEDDGEDIAEWSFPIATTRGSLSPLASGEGLVLRVDVFDANGDPLSGGRSFPFDLVEGAAAPHPDLFVGTVGKFARSLADVDVPAVAHRAISATADGALLAGADGVLRHYRAHDRREGHSGEATIEVVATIPDAADRSFVGFGPGLLLAFGGAAGDALLYGSDGALLDTLAKSDEPRLAEHAFEATTAQLEGSAVLLVGGTPTPGGPESGAVTRLEASASPSGTTELILTELPQPLPTARRGARAVAVDVLGSGRADCPCERVLVVGGTAGASAVPSVDLIDPEGIDATVEITTPAARRGAALLPLVQGFVLVAGGEATDGTAVASVDVMSMSTEDIRVLSDAPEPLFFPRRGATSVVFEPNLGIIVGGYDAAGTPIPTAELYRYPLPGKEDAPTGPLSRAVGEVQAALLGDGTLLVAGESLIEVYVLSRAPRLETSPP